MLKGYYENLLFKPFRIQCFFILLIAFSISTWLYLEFIKKEKTQLQHQILACKKLEKTHEEEKQYSHMLIAHKKTFSDHVKAYHYLNTPKTYHDPSFLISEIALLALKKRVHLNQIELKKDMSTEIPNHFQVHLKLLGNYKTLSEFYVFITKQPYLVEMEKFAIETFNKARRGHTLYAEFLIKIYVFT